MFFSRIIKFAALLALLAAGLPTVRGFTPIGPLTPWMDNNTLPEYPGDPGGGPMNITDAYRWNVPIIYYAFDPTFVSYFGTNGINAVESAIKVFNDLPTASNLDYNKYPLYSARVNYRASALLLQDVKSWTMYAMIEALGLASPERYVFCVRNMSHDAGGNPYFTVIKRNFDPDTAQSSSYVNGVLYTYFIGYTAPDSPAGETARATEVPVDPLSRRYTTVAAGMAGLGEFYTGLTRDDVAAIKYIYSKNRPAPETVLNVSSVTGISVAGGDSSGWQVALNTNITDIGSIDTTVLVGTSGGWYSLNITNNTVSTNTTGGTTTGDVTTTTTNSYVDVALRPGVDKLTFVRLNYDSVYGVFKPVTNVYVDTYITNGIVRRQVLQRAVLRPDMAFLAGDLGFDNGAPQLPIPAFSTGPNGWFVNTGANGTGYPDVPGGTIDGPGVIPAADATGAFEMWFSKLGPNYFNGLSFLNEATAQPGAGGLFMWGSYDGSTNEPIVYPKGTSLKEIEDIINGN